MKTVKQNWIDLKDELIGLLHLGQGGNNHPNIVHAIHIIGKILCLAEYLRNVIKWPTYER